MILSFHFLGERIILLCNPVSAMTDSGILTVLDKCNQTGILTVFGLVQSDWYSYCFG